MINQTVQWIEERTLLNRLLRAKMDAPVTAGRWRAATGAAVVFLLIFQILTGFVITFYYVPSATQAHISVLYLMKEVEGGLLLRSAHHYSAHALVLLSIVYLLQLFYGAEYKRRR